MRKSQSVEKNTHNSMYQLVYNMYIACTNVYRPSLRETSVEEMEHEIPNLRGGTTFMCILSACTCIILSWYIFEREQDCG